MLTAIDTGNEKEARRASAAISPQPLAPASAIAQPPFRRFFKAIMRPSLRQGLVVIVDQGLCSITNFVTGLTVTRACSKEEYGLYVLGFTTLMMVQGFQTSLTSVPFTVLSPGLKGHERRTYLGSTLIQHLTLSSLAGFGFLLAALVVSLTGRTDNFSSVLLALAPASLFILLRDFTRYVLLAQLRVWASLLMALVANVGTIALLSWSTMRGSLSAPTAYLIVGGCSALPVLFVLARERARISFAVCALRHTVKKNWLLGKWLVANTGTSLLYNDIYPLTLMFLWGSAAAAEYGACMVLMSILNTFLLGVMRFLDPKAVHAARRGPEYLRRTVYTSMLVITLPAVAFVLGLSIWSTETLNLVFGPEYSGIDALLLILAIEAGINAIACPICSGLTALKETRARFSGGAVAAGLSLLFGIPLVFLLGPMGAGVGLLFSRGAKWLYLWTRFKRSCQ